MQFKRGTMKNILVTGGAGYIGSHAVYDLQKHGYKCVILDNLSEGHEESTYISGGKLEKVDLNDLPALGRLFNKYRFDGVLHFAGFINVGESVNAPKKYYQNNAVCTQNLLNAVVDRGVKYMVFSSTCAVYGNPQYLPLDEKHPRDPINPYGKTKLMTEFMLEDYCAAYGLKYASLRYFNASGADESGLIGESHNIETHLIPLVLKTLTGERDSIKIFGNDYDTPDGTCIRDYIHVNDLASAHRQALEKLWAGMESGCFNLGTGNGHSVKEIISACEEVAGRRVNAAVTERRPGDPPSLVASNDKAKKILEWNPKYMDIKEIIRTAWQWEQHRKY